jgi:hypothetical protein
LAAAAVAALEERVDLTSLDLAVSTNLDQVDLISQGLVVMINQDLVDSINQQAKEKVVEEKERNSKSL